ncbi:hypothetical protein GOY07_03660 [Wolbachia endosymbiont of Litomosoides sigmodontis]|uniref:hypothetical protein n=1 Tax=Wolbachia endosymbiont of Litomosoides sigmodontis TaxID=80850 RepID=UPI00158AD87E|nr:hypothetical protein [Wolbachia endosymbiont of Litomosoides sigmodontis]QKX03239.1 hypothetical protein GOY07_03660 [Wolbachia endosymbiont of Litomosoides sigmodontis]
MLQDRGTAIKISEFLNSKFYKNHKIVDFAILNNDDRKIISNYVVESDDGKKVRCYDLANSSLYECELQFIIGT